MRSLTPLVKKLIFINVGVWIFLVLIVQNFFNPDPDVFNLFGLVPLASVLHLHIWQFFTYMFVHSNELFHILFNMLILWWIGGDLEESWGKKFFLTYYFACGLGAALFYNLSIFAYHFILGSTSILTVPVVGASGAIFGLILAYGILFGERIIYFMMLFPMKAKYFVLILGGIELLTLLNTGVRGRVANLAHLGGLVAGFLFLRGFVFWSQMKRKKGKYWWKINFWRFFSKKKKHLKLVIDEDSEPKNKRYWH